MATDEVIKERRSWKSMSPIRQLAIIMTVVGAGLIVVYALWLPHAPTGHIQWYLLPGALMVFIGVIASFANDLGDNWDWSWRGRGR